MRVDLGKVITMTIIITGLLLWMLRCESERVHHKKMMEIVNSNSRMSTAKEVVEAFEYYDKIK